MKLEIIYIVPALLSKPVSYLNYKKFFGLCCDIFILENSLHDVAHGTDKRPIFLEPFGPLQACNGTALPLPVYSFILNTPKSKLYQWHEHMLALLLHLWNVPVSNPDPETRPVTIFQAFYDYSQTF